MERRSNSPDTVSVTASLMSDVRDPPLSAPLQEYLPASDSVTGLNVCSCRSLKAMAEPSLYQLYCQLVTPSPSMSHLRVTVSPLNTC